MIAKRVVGGCGPKMYISIMENGKQNKTRRKFAWGDIAGQGFRNEVRVLSQ